jgi:predicted dehydrogenase
LARERGVPTITGLQGRFVPAVAYARRLVEDGYVGRVLSARAYADYDAFGENIAVAYSADERANAHILIIGGGHILDMLFSIVGDVRDVSGLLSYQRDSGFALDLHRRIKMTAPDQFAAHGTLTSGAVFAAHLVGSASYGQPCRMHVIGTEGQLVLETDGMPQIASLTLSGARGADSLSVLEIPSEHLPPTDDLRGPAVGMAVAYSRLPDDLSAGVAPLPDFEHGLKVHRFLDAIKSASRTGVRQTVLD